MKKLFIGASALLVSLAITACGGSKKPAESEPKDSEPATSEPAESEPTESEPAAAEIDYDSVAQFELTTDSFKELEASTKRGVLATLDALDNFNLKAELKNVNAGVTTDTVVLDANGGEFNRVKTDIVSVENLNLGLSAGLKGLRSAEKASELEAYLKLDELKGSVTTMGTLRYLIAMAMGYEPEVDSEGTVLNPIDTETPVEINADLENSLSAYLHEGTVYADIDVTTFDFVGAVLTEVGLDSLVPMIDAFKGTPKLMAKVFDEEYDPELNINFPTEEDLFPAPESGESAEELEYAALINGMLEAAELELSDLATIKVASDENHALGIKVSIDEDNFANIVNFAEFVSGMMNEISYADDEEGTEVLVLESAEDESEEEATSPFDVLRAMDFTSLDVLVELDAESRLSKLEVNLGELSSLDNIVSESETEAGGKLLTILNVEGVKFDLSLAFDYDTDVASYIPVDTFVPFDAETAPDGYTDLTPLIKMFLPTGEEESELPSGE